MNILANEKLVIETDINYDYDLSRHTFDESFKSLSYEDFSLLNDRFFKVNIYQFIDYGNSKEFDLFDPENYNFTKSDIDSYLHEIENHYGLLEASQCYLDTTYSKLTKSELLELIENIDYDGINGFLLSLPESKRLFEVVAIRGHCQGDYAEIVIPNELIETYNFNDKGKWLSDMEGYFTNLFYNSPVYGSLTVYDGEKVDEFLFHEWSDDQYNYDEDHYLELVDKYFEHTKKDAIANWLKDNLPSHPDYH